MRKKLSLLLVALMAVVTGSWAAGIKVAYNLKVGDTFTSGQSVEVKSGETLVATIVYGEEGGADFAAATADAKAGFVACTAGNGVNGNKPKGTFYTITPKFDGNLEVGVILNADKKFYIKEDGTALEGYDGITVASKVNGSYCVQVKKDKAYRIYCDGSKLGFYGFRFFSAPDEIAADNFDFTALNVKTSSSESSEGDLFAKTIFNDSKSSVKMTLEAANPQTGTINRFWSVNDKPQLRVYNGTMTFEAPEKWKITEIVFDYGKWNDGNTVDWGTGNDNSSDKKYTWTGSNNKVVFTIAGNTQINSIKVTAEEGGKEAYAIYNPETQTLTFMYDKNKPDEYAWLCGETGEEWPGWNDYGYKFVVFDDSFADARPTSCYGWFAKWDLTNIVGWSNFNTSEVTNMAYMFSNASQLKSLNLDKINTQNVTTMERMFQGCQNIEELDLSKFNTEKVINMGGMFSDCQKLAKLNLSSFNTANVENMSSMFNRCFALTKLDLSNFNTEKVEDMNSMFSMPMWGWEPEGTTPKLESINLSSFNTANVTDMAAMFNNCGALKSLDLSSFNTEKVYNMNDMFYNDSTLTAIKLSSFDTKSVWNMRRMFWGCKALTELDLSNFDVSSVGDMAGMFQGCAKLAKLNIDNFDTQNVNSYYNMFNGCAELTELNLMKFDTQNGAYDMYYMFNGCAKLAKVKATNLFVNYNYDNMFTGCVKLPEFDENIVSGQDAIDKYFSISKVLFNDYVKAGEYITYYQDNALKIYGEVGALYTITGVSATEVAVKELKVAAKKTPLLVLNESEEDAKIMIVEAAADEKADDVKPYAGFLGTLVNKNIAGSTEGLNYYVCNGNEFVWVWQGDWINAHRCWLVIEEADAAAAPCLNIVEGEFSLTGINSVKAADQKSAEIYDLQGRKVGNAQKGMYIMNGKKVVLK